METQTLDRIMQMVDSGQASIDDMREAQERQERERAEQERLAQEKAHAEMLELARSCVPPELAEFVMVYPFYRDHSSKRTASIQVPGFAEIHFWLEWHSKNGMWQQSEYKNFKAWRYSLLSPDRYSDDPAEKIWHVGLDHNTSQFTQDVCIALAYAKRFGEERGQLQAEAEQRNEVMRENEEEQNREQLDLQKLAKELPDPTPDEVLVGALKDLWEQWSS